MGVAIGSAMVATLLACAPAAEKPAEGATMGAATGTLAEPNITEIRTSIEAANQRAVTAMLGGDMPGSVANYADSAIFMMPGMPMMRGRVAIEDGMKGMMSGMKVTAAQFRTEDVIASGDLAIETGTFTVTTVPTGGKSMEDKGKYLTVWQRQGDGSWKVVRDINNADTQPAPPR